MSGPIVHPRFWPTAIAILIGLAGFSFALWYPRIKRLWRRWFPR